MRQKRISGLPHFTPPPFSPVTTTNEKKGLNNKAFGFY